MPNLRSLIGLLITSNLEPNNLVDSLASAFPISVSTCYSCQTFGHAGTGTLIIGKHQCNWRTALRELVE